MERCEADRAGCRRPLRPPRRASLHRLSCSPFDWRACPLAGDARGDWWRRRGWVTSERTAREGAEAWILGRQDAALDGDINYIAKKIFLLKGKIKVNSLTLRLNLAIFHIFEFSWNIEGSWNRSTSVVQIFSQKRSSIGQIIKWIWTKEICNMCNTREYHVRVITHSFIAQIMMGNEEKFLL